MARSVEKYRLKAPNIEKSSFSLRNRPLERPFLQRRDNTRSPSENRPLQGPILSGYTMALTPQDIARIAHLARLELKPEEGARMQSQINGFFDIVEKMRAVDTAGVEPLAHPVAAFEDVHLRLRDDVVTDGNQREANQ